MNTEPLLSDDTELVYVHEQAPEDYLDPSKYVQDTDPDSSIHYNLRTLSYSGLLTLHSCPRKFELYRLLPRGIETDEEGHLGFGAVVGNGIQELLVTRSIDKAFFRAFLDWDDELDSPRGEKHQKTFWHALQAIQNFTEVMNGPLASYEVAEFNGKPATELGYRIDLGDGFTIRGKLDALLVHRVTREFLPLECKTTGSYTVHEAMYQNSSQGLGYGVVIDTVAHQMEKETNSYDVVYPVYQTRKSEWTVFRFNKSNNQRALWLQDILLDKQAIQQFSDLEYFPKRGESCMSFNRECPHFGLCTMSNSALIDDPESIPVKLDKVTEYPLEYSIYDLIETQAAKTGKD